MEIKVFEAFAGYGSQMMALRRLQRQFPDLRFTPVGISEIDKCVRSTIISELRIY